MTWKEGTFADFLSNLCIENFIHGTNFTLDMFLLFDDFRVQSSKCKREDTCYSLSACYKTHRQTQQVNCNGWEEHRCQQLEGCFS